MFEDLLPAWGGEEVVVRFDEPSATWMFVCVHSTVLGPGAGGTRMKVYAEPRDALQDGLRLSSAMTSKNAMAGLPLGGGKAVLAVPEIPTGER
ncbi:MAG TPA: Glu/Leu/Phe/Val dehydrogenase dimerization domain-containing protein, partial [Gaiella sp.]|nr:Glu/Leu/Phe/Val dehydrogenase dimerization domain-containing protein [Gaiella sp.]